MKPSGRQAVSAVVAASESASAARKDIDELTCALKCEGVETDSLIAAVAPFFIGAQADCPAARHVKASGRLPISLGLWGAYGDSTSAALNAGRK